MQATITYLLTEQAQRAQMAAIGQPVARKQVKTIEVAPEDLNLFRVDAEGAATLDITSHWSAGAGYVGEIADANADVVALVRAKAQRAAQEKTIAEELTRANGEANRRAADAAYQRFMADPSARIGWNQIRDYVGVVSPADWWPEAHAELVVERDRRNAADVAAKKAAEDAKEAAKTQWLDEWVAESEKYFTHATLKKQWAEGLLARRDLLNMIAKESLADIGVPAAHEVKTCPSRNCGCHDTDIATLPLKEYAAWDKIREHLPEGTKAEFSEVADCLRDSDGEFDEETGDCTEPYYTALLHIPVGPFVFDRRIKLEMGPFTLQREYEL